MIDVVQPAAEPDVQYHRPIHQWDKAERPREKLIARGPQALSDAELIALIFGNGTKTKQGSLSAVQLGQALLQTYGSLGALAKKDRKLLERIVGIGPAKAVQLLAAFEIGRRVEAQGDGERVQVCAPSDVAAAYGPKLRDLKREVFVVVLLNTANVITGDFTVSEGGLAASIVEPRAVFQRGRRRERGGDRVPAQPPVRESRAEPGGRADHQTARRSGEAHGHSRPRPPHHRRAWLHLARRARAAVRGGAGEPRVERRAYSGTAENSATTAAVPVTLPPVTTSPENETEPATCSLDDTVIVSVPPPSSPTETDGLPVSK